MDQLIIHPSVIVTNDSIFWVSFFLIFSSYSSAVANFAPSPILPPPLRSTTTTRRRPNPMSSQPVRGSRRSAWPLADLAWCYLSLVNALPDARSAKLVARPGEGPGPWRIWVEACRRLPRSTACHGAPSPVVAAALDRPCVQHPYTRRYAHLCQLVPPHSRVG